MTVTGFTPLEAATLLRLWDDEPDWWRFIYHLSDRFQDDGDEDAARFIRWLCGWGYRPCNHPDYLKMYGLFWLWTANDEVVKGWLGRKVWGIRGAKLNILPFEFKDCCAGVWRAKGRHNFDTPAEAVEAAMDCWRTLTEEQKADLEANWRASQ